MRIRATRYLSNRGARSLPFRGSRVGPLRGGRAGPFRGGRAVPFRGGRAVPFKPKVLRTPFDVHECGSFSPCLQSLPEDNVLIEAILKRNQDLTPTEQEQVAVFKLSMKIQWFLNIMALSPHSFAPCEIDEVHEVGSFKKGTMMTGMAVAHIVVILKTFPTLKAVQDLGSKVVGDLRKDLPPIHVDILYTNEGFQIRSQDAVVQCLITTILPNMRKLDPEIHLNQKILLNNFSAVRRFEWFKANANHINIKVLIRLLKDMCYRFEGFQYMNVWTIELLAHYVTKKQMGHQPLGLNVTYRQCLELLAAGLFLPGVNGISDLCLGERMNVHAAMTLEQQEILCETAQKLLHVFCHGGYKQVLGLQNNPIDILTETSVWGGMVISPLGRVYEEEEEPGKDMEEEASNMIVKLNLTNI